MDKEELRSAPGIGKVECLKSQGFSMSKSLIGWTRVFVALLVATPLALMWNRPAPSVASTGIDPATTSEIQKSEAPSCGSGEWPSPRNCDTHKSVRIITPTTTKVPAEAFRLAEIQVAKQMSDLMKPDPAIASKPLPTIVSQVSAKPHKSKSQKYARRAPSRSVGITMLGYGY